MDECEGGSRRATLSPYSPSIWVRLPDYAPRSLATRPHPDGSRDPVAYLAQLCGGTLPIRIARSARNARTLEILENLRLDDFGGIDTEIKPYRASGADISAAEWPVVQRTRALLHA